ncbi:hypothetical protein DH2020_023860 [Rehmannia glutinosa]|uniref:Suppressor of forked domain-containing protein n=1 Tax=Rehmannia glutinosa TaxID=99300 RepID=A0ABR0W808_REHGL
MANGTAESNTLSITDGNADKFNAEAAEILANEALRLPMSDAVPIYEQLLATFPTSAKYWKQYVEALMAVNNDEATRQAKGLVAEYQPKYNSARAVYRERKKYVDEIDWNMLAIPPSGSSKATPRELTVLLQSNELHLLMSRFEMLKYAYAELEESHGAAQAAKKVYESLVGDGVNATALSHIQVSDSAEVDKERCCYVSGRTHKGMISSTNLTALTIFIRFLRRTEGVEAARRYFLDARKSPNCTYHVYVAYAMMAFCLDKDAKLAHNIFEAGLKRFMHEPSYILEYADFLCRLNDDRNIRALFERALSSLPPDESVEVEQRRKEALCRTAENGESALENSLQDVISRYSFMDLWPCSSKDLDHLARQEVIISSPLSNLNNSAEHVSLLSDRSISGIPNNPNISGKIVYPDVSRMMIYGPRQQTGPPAPGISGVPLPNGVTVNSGGTTAIDDILKVLPPSLATFVSESASCRSNITSSVSGKSGTPQQLQAGPAPSTSDVSGSSKFKQTRDRQPGKRKDSERQDDDDTSTVQSQPLPRDAFKMRQLQKARATSSRTGGSASYGSGFSGDFSGSSG